MERPLALHQSALSEPEYQAYTCILHEIAPDTAGVEWEAAQVPMGEAKGWIRGKYAVDAALLDQILRLFPATAFQGTLIKGPQLLAILRLISHAQAGLGVDRSLVFTQATKPLGSDIQTTPNVIPLGSPLPPPPSRSSPYPKPPPPVRQGSSSHTAPPDGATSGGRRVSSEDTASRTSLSSNPFRRSLSQNPGGIGGAGSAAYPRSHSAAGADDESSDGGRRSPTYSAPAITRASRPPSVTRSSSRKAGTPDASPFPSNNPFFRSPDSTAVTLPVTLPPLPPRKPPSQATSPPPPPPSSHGPIQPPPRHPAPPPPPKIVRKPSHTHSTSTSNLIRQSLIAAKTAPKAPEGTLASAMKSLVIVKSSSSNQPSSSTSTSGGTLKDRVRGEREKEKSSDSSGATTTAFSQSGRSVVTSSSTPTSSASASSMEYVAGARVHPPPKPLIRSTATISTTTPAATAPHSRSASPTKLSPTKLSMAEAQDIVQISASPPLSSTSVSSTDLASMNRPVRSKSLHGTASSGSMKGPVPTPPPRRRPESVQVTGSPFANAPTLTSAPSATTTSTNSPFNLSRRSSVQHPPPRPAHSPSPSRSTSTSVRSPVPGTTTPPSHKEDPFSSIYSTVKHHLAPKSAESGVNTSIFQPAAAELQKIGSKLEGGLAPGRGYISHRGVEGERLVKKGYDDDDDGDADGYHRLSTYSDAPTVDSDTPGMDTNPPDPSPTTRFPPTSNNTESWMNWDPTPGPRPMPSRGSSDATITKSKPASPTYSSSSARSSQQRRDVQLELDQLRAQRMEGWGRMS